MCSFLRSHYKKWSALIVVPWLVACGSVAPGMHFDPRAGYSSSGSASSTASSDGDAAAVNTSDVHPIIKDITPQLVKEQREKRNKQGDVSDIKGLVADAKPYSIQAGDILSIIVWDHPELATGAAAVPSSSVAQQGVPGAENPGNGTQSSGFVVDQNGVLHFPYAGSIKVAGLTEPEAKRQLTTKLARYIRNPDVTLRVQSYRSKRVYIDGEVKTPGLQPITDIPMTLTEAVNRAGGFLPTADQSQVTITRAGKTYKINMLQMAQRGVNPSSIMLANGDEVRVLSRDDNKIFVSGEVVQPRSLPMHNGRMTLNEALGEAGGINPQTGDGEQVYVIRNATDKNPLVYHLNTRSPSGLTLAEEFELEPKDVVYVDAAPLATWHRVVSLIFPSALSNAFQAGATAGHP